MRGRNRVIVLMVVALAAGAIVASKAARTPPRGGAPLPALPALVDVGANRCAPCKAMVPVVERLRRETAGRLHVEFVDAWADPDGAERWKARVLPTQIFLDAHGRELARHEGFMSEEAILARFRELGVPLD